MLPAMPRSVGSRPTESPPNVLCPWHNRQPATPIPQPQYLAYPDQYRPDLLENAHFNPVLEGPVDGVVVSEFLWPPIPVAPSAHPKDDAVQDAPGINPLATCILGRDHFQNDRMNLIPEIVRDLPYAWQGLALSHHHPPPDIFSILIQPDVSPSLFEIVSYWSFELELCGGSSSRQIAPRQLVLDRQNQLSVRPRSPRHPSARCTTWTYVAAHLRQG